MLRKHALMFNIINRVLDLCILLIITWLVGQKYGSTELTKVLAIYGSLLMVVIFSLSGIYDSWRNTSISGQIRFLFFVWLSVLVIFNIIIILLCNKQQMVVLWPFALFRAPEFLYWSASVFLGLAAERIIVRIALNFLRKKGYNQRTVVIAGAGEEGAEAARVFLENPWLGFDIKCFFDDDPAKADSSVAGKKVAGQLNEIVSYVKKNKIDMVYITSPVINDLKTRNIIADLCETSADIYLIPDVFNITLLKMSLSDVSGLPVINLNDTPCSGLNEIVKKIEDKLVAIIILIMISPLMLLIALGIKMTSPGPVLFRQRRYGINGEDMVILKFRTMTVCEDGPDIPQAVKCDPRVTRLGSFLRRTSLDELPQFINVLEGSMSVVGPRPHAVAHNEQYRRLIKSYMLRHKMKPGITGWAQINGLRGETDTLEKMKKRVEYDLYYINNWSLWLDIKIILITAFIGFTGKNAY